MDNEGKDTDALGEPAAPRGVNDMRPRRAKNETPTDEERRDMHVSFNNRISYLCKLAALVVAVVSLATVVLGQDNTQFVLLGLCMSVALLAIAALQDHRHHK